MSEGHKNVSAHSQLNCNWMWHRLMLNSERDSAYCRISWSFLLSVVLLLRIWALHGFNQWGDVIKGQAVDLCTHPASCSLQTHSTATHWGVNSTTFNETGWSVRLSQQICVAGTLRASGHYNANVFTCDRHRNVLLLFWSEISFAGQSIITFH